MGFYNRKLHVGRKLTLYGEDEGHLSISFISLAQILSSTIPIFVPDPQKS